MARENKSCWQETGRSSPDIDLFTSIGSAIPPACANKMYIGGKVDRNFPIHKICKINKIEHKYTFQCKTISKLMCLHNLQVFFPRRFVLSLGRLFEQENLPYTVFIIKQLISYLSPIYFHFTS